MFPFFYWILPISCFLLLLILCLSPSFVGFSLLLIISFSLCLPPSVYWIVFHCSSYFLSFNISHFFHSFALPPHHFFYWLIFSSHRCSSLSSFIPISLYFLISFSLLISFLLFHHSPSLSTSHFYSIFSIPFYHPILWNFFLLLFVSFIPFFFIFLLFFLPPFFYFLWFPFLNSLSFIPFSLYSTSFFSL